ncbi:SMP-30/gluconolactonase/LRE family protein [Psychroserpens algicola]|uniref:Uncharacterized protein n=1 Tax=Psychroserpens algicola TaxID=1719034 RepID=A0ABT0H623_9FLAO|nr:hypothetical protein [Psychroserpens algicola]MCK8479811.1 hypothetical protein [Psychroserpens algicola]
MRKLKLKWLLIIMIVVTSCERNASIEMDSYLSDSYNLTIDDGGIYIKRINDGKQNVNFSDLTQQNKKDKLYSINGKSSNHRINNSIGFINCFYGSPFEVIECLQNYVGNSEVVFNFNPQIPDNPESVVIDSDNNFIVSMALSGQLVKVTREGERTLFATLPIGQFIPGAFTGLMGALAIDSNDNIYVNVNASESSKRGVWKVSPNGNSELIGLLPMNAVPNGIVLVNDYLYIADSGFDGKIWRLNKFGGQPEVWADDPLLKLINLGIMTPGPNGIQFYNEEIYVSNPNQGLLLAISRNSDGTSGEIRIISDNVFLDDFAIDALGNVIGTTDPLNTIEKIYPDGSKEVLLNSVNPLDGPTAAIFGRYGLDRFNLYITNAAFPFFTDNFTPNLMKLELGIPGIIR